ncbi:MAG TPA: hypothetical protein PLY87_18055 [Planctomycetaceae bacterium]|nr:hypothetical protein [Planctomycetaceae bacterium]
MVPCRTVADFLGYGHDGNEELVRRIKSNLEQRGHDVRFNKSKQQVPPPSGIDYTKSLEVAG